MPMLKDAAEKIFSAFGYRLVSVKSLPVPWAWDSGLTHFFPLVKSFGFAPKRIWDVGANRGNWTRVAIRYFPATEYTLFEPQDDLKKHIQDLLKAGHNIRWINAGIGARPGVLPLYVSAGGTTGSTFLDLPRVTEGAAGCIEVPIRTLNEVLATSSAPAPEMLKIDAEGMDLKVLVGASDLLGATEIILAEASINQSDFENTAQAIIQAMDSYGYRLIDITDLNPSPTHHVLWLYEFAFLCKSSHLLDRASNY